MEKYYSFNTKRKLILSEETSQELLNIFAQDKSWIIRRMVAESLQTPVFLLKVLSLDGYLPVAHAAILNKNFPKRELPYVLKKNLLLRNLLNEIMVRKILLIDDLRDFKLISDDTTIVVARSSEEALNILREHHDWDEIWLDHDLGTVDGVEDTIMPVVDYLVEYAHTHKGERVGRRFFIHSSNPAGVENIKRALATVGIPAFKISGNISLTAER